VNGQERRRGVVVSPEKLENLKIAVLAGKAIPGGAKVRLQGFVFFLDCQPPDPRKVIEVRAKLCPGIMPALQCLQAGEVLSGLLLVQPEIGLGGLLFDLVDLTFQRGGVKDPSRFLRSVRRGSSVSVRAR
jgi:hypothetical protein